MKVTGFSFIRNAIKFDYPVTESVRSILPLCDDFVIAVGNSEDQTNDLIKNIDPKKIKIIHTVWDESLREGGKVLANETNKAFQAIDEQTDWCFYIQADEVVHEKYLPAIRTSMEKWKDDRRVDGLLFNYLHFYGSYDYVGSSNRWYKHEIRIIRNNKNFYSYRDAQGFRKFDDQKLNVKLIDAYIYHYGWVKHPASMQKKVENATRLYRDDNWMKDNFVKAAEYDYTKNIDALQRFNGTHPAVMIDRIHKNNWQFDYDISFNKTSLKEKSKNFLQRHFNMDLNYRNYKLLK